jgi:hypothetical protein
MNGLRCFRGIRSRNCARSGYSKRDRAMSWSNWTIGLADGIRVLKLSAPTGMA